MGKYRKFSTEEKYRIVEEAHQPGVAVTEVFALQRVFQKRYGSPECNGVQQQTARE